MFTRIWDPAPLKLARPHTAVHIWAAALQVSVETRQRLSQTLSDDEQARAKRYRRPLIQQCLVVSRGILRDILSRYLPLAPRAISFKYTAHGKPGLQLPADSPPLYFNVTHSHNLALYAISGDAEVGIDLEYLPRALNIAQVAPHILTKKEHHLLRELPETQHRAQFFKYWTRKEAVVKAIGKGLSLSLQTFDVSNDTITFTTKDQTEQWQVHTFTPMANHIAAVAVPQHDWQLQFFQY